MPVDRVTAPDHLRARGLGRLAVSWIEHFCVHGPGDVAGRPLDPNQPEAIPLTDELAALTADAYALEPAGRRVYDSVFYSRPKGADKSGHAARIALFEAFGPCRFAGWAEGGEVYRWLDFEHEYRPGEAMGRRITFPFVRLLATEEGQVGNVYGALLFNLQEGPLREAVGSDDAGLTRTFIPDGGEIRPSTASSSAKDGGKETFAVFDETHLYVLPELRRMYDTVRRNLAKRKDAEPWSFETTTMYEPGRDSVAELSFELVERIRSGRVRRPRLLFDHRSAPADVDLTDEPNVRAALAEAYGEAASYMDLDRLVSEIWDTRNDVSDSRRFFFNQATAAYDAWIAPHEWDRLADLAHPVKAEALVTLGFDGSKTDDHTALIVCEVATGHVLPLGVWDPEAWGGEAPRAEIVAAVRSAFERFTVVGFYSDVHPWESYVDAWTEEYGEQLYVAAAARAPIAWDMRGHKLETTKMIERFHDGVMERVIKHNGDRQLAQHVHNARRRPNSFGVGIGKDAAKSPHKIDAAVAACLAWQARHDYLALPAGKQHRVRTGKAMFA